MSVRKLSKQTTALSKRWGVEIPTYIKTNLTLYLDAGVSASYPGTGSTWYDLSGNGYNFTINASAWKTGSPAYMDFGGSYGNASRATNVPSSTSATIMIFSSIKNSTADWRTLMYGDNVNYVLPRVQAGSNTLGTYNNAFYSSGFDVSTLPNPYTQFNCWTWRLAQSSPYYRFNYNQNTTNYDITNSAASFQGAFRIIGSEFNSTQWWGNIAALLYYQRSLSDAEITQNYNYFKSRFGLT